MVADTAVSSVFRNEFHNLHSGQINAEGYGISAPGISSALFNPYSWALLAVLIISAYTGWNRRYDTGEEESEAA